MLIVQTFIAFQSFVLSTDMAASFERSGLSSDITWMPNWLKLWSPEWLAGDADCTTVLSQVRPKRGPHYCGTLYAVVTGQLVLHGDMTVQFLSEHVFALSGVPFLLLVR